MSNSGTTTLHFEGDGNSKTDSTSVSHRRVSHPFLNNDDSDVERPSSPINAITCNKIKDTPPSSPKPILDVGNPVEVGQPLEIDQHENMDEDDYDVDADLERLLGDVTSSEEKNQEDHNDERHCCCGLVCDGPKRGETRVLFPDLFARTGWGMVGPHWFGPACVLLILLWASLYFVKRATHIGPVTTATTVFFAILTAYTLCNCSFRDPGIVTSQTPDKIVSNLREWRWCDLCNVHQPPDGQHCPDCNVCVEGYDHHCVWMGTCIGKKNMKQFIRFNLSWLAYLIYSVVWISVLGPQMYNKKH